MFYNKKIEEIENELNTSDKGLSTNYVNTNREKYGINVLPKKKKDSIFQIFFNEFKDPILLLLLFAVIVSFLAGEIVDSIAIIFIVLIDVIIGTYQENKANNTAEALQKLVKTKTKVIRNGELITIDAEELVVGDYVFLESGDKISADMRIVEAQNFAVDESILTGESLQVVKNEKVIKKKNISINEQANMIFSGTNVVTGRARAIVV